MRQVMVGMAMLLPPWRVNIALGVLWCVATSPSLGGGELVKHQHQAIQTSVATERCCDCGDVDEYHKLARLLPVEKCCCRRGGDGVSK
jgi:hypothetical protein